MVRHAKIRAAPGVFLTIEASGEAICRVAFCGGEEPAAPEGDDALLARAAAELREYFAGARRWFDLPLAPGGSGFQQRVWAAVSGIPYGETRTYG
jgi:methylated-DNA-[protein]-cysteine S-methyltransferase